MGVLDKLNAASRAQRTHALCLDASLQAEHDRLIDQLDAAAALDAQEASLAEPAKHLTALVDQLDAIRDRMQASMVTFIIGQMAWTERIALQALHPPRPDQALDVARGYNLATFLPAIIRASTVSVADADGDVATEIPDESWDNLFSALNFAGVNRLSAMALAVNDQDAAVPTSARSLLGSQDSGASLAQPDPGSSAPAGSEDGSRRTSRSTPTTKKAASPA